jgi:hypothetical protein
VRITAEEAERCRGPTWFQCDVGRKSDTVLLHLSLPLPACGTISHLLGFSAERLCPDASAHPATVTQHSGPATEVHL